MDARRLDKMEGEQETMTLDDAISYYDEVAEKCRRKANIEQNDYMDLKDNASEAEQLADWLNELKLLRDRIAIQQEQREDAVSRTELLHTFEKNCYPVHYDHNSIDVGMTLPGIVEVLNITKSVTPNRKTGKWNFIGDQMFECSECGTCYTQSQFYQMRVRISDTEFPKFCPNCGADMRGDNR